MKHTTRPGHTIAGRHRIINININPWMVRTISTRERHRAWIRTPSSGDFQLCAANVELGRHSVKGNVLDSEEVFSSGDAAGDAEGEAGLVCEFPRGFSLLVRL